MFFNLLRRRDKHYSFSSVRHARLGLEELESRIVPAQLLEWTGKGQNTLWSNKENWKIEGTLNTIPMEAPVSGDTLTFPAGNLQPFISTDDIGKCRDNRVASRFR